MEKATDIKRRAQRCLQNGDLDGALSEYGKLTRAEDPEPINFVVMADLLFKKGEPAEASRRYLEAVDAYTEAGLHKNAIAVCKKMARLSLSAAVVLQRLAELHLRDGLSTEAALYYQEYAEHQARERRFGEAAASLRRAFEISPESARVLEKASEWLLEAGDAGAAASVLLEAARHYTRRGQSEEAARVRARAEELEPGTAAAQEAGSAIPGVPFPVTVAEPPSESEPGAGVEPRPPMEPVSGLDGDPSCEVPSTMGTPPRPTDTEVMPSAPAEGRLGRMAAGPAAAGTPDLQAIEDLLQLAAKRFRKGERELASDALIEAAGAYEAMERLESAAAIYRSLGRSTHGTPEVLGLWLRNCELRGDAHEAAEVACGLGERSLSEGDVESAGEWFARALHHVPGHELAGRRLQRLGARAGGADGAGTSGGRGAFTEADGRVEVAVGRAQAVTLDLGSLIAEFQRGIESQLSGDAQSHYDLGMTYREMGLLEQAVECFRAARSDPAFARRAAEMIGRCLLDQGRFDDAVAEFSLALEDLAAGSEAGICLRFQLGLAHEVAGRAPEALAEFERVYAVQPNYPDVAQKIRLLRRTLERV